MISSINSSTQSIGYIKIPAPVNKPLPVDSTAQSSQSASSSVVDISQRALDLFAAKALTSTPVLVAAVSDNAQVDELATSIYSAQQNEQMIATYENSASNSANSDGGTSTAKLLAISAATQNPQVDEMATTVFSARQAQQLLSIYQNNAAAVSETQPATLDQTA